MFKKMFFLTLNRQTSLKYDFLRNILKGISSTFTGHQTLFTASSLGIDKFEIRKKKCESKFVKSKDTFMKTMKQFCEDKEKDYSIYTEDLKNMIYLCQNDPCDLELLMEMSKKFNVAGQKNRIVDFAFGPEFMRLYYHLNLPNEAKKALHEKDLQGLFSQVSSYMIAMTLFYNAGLYHDVLEAMDQMVEQRISIRTFTKGNFLLAMAACYQLNSVSSLECALSLIKRLEEAGGKVDPRSLGFAAALALKQGKGKVAFELTSKANFTHYLLQNIKAEALIALDRVEDALPILRGCAESAAPVSSAVRNYHVILAQTVEAVEKALKEGTNKNALAEFEIIKKMLESKKVIAKKSVEETLCEPINLDGRSATDEHSKLSERQLNRAMITASFNQSKDKRLRETKFNRQKGFNNFDF